MSCKHCGECCGLVPFTKKDLERIRKNYKHNFQFFELAKGLFLHKQSFENFNNNIDLNCPFLDKTKKENKCSIYEFRPDVCKKFGIIKELKCDKW